MNPPPATSGSSWRPPSDTLILRDGVWQAPIVSAVSYPDAGNEVCFQIEDGSFWFNHRMDCIQTLIRQFPPEGTLYDIGGGNGFVAAALQRAGLDVALLEPGAGARNALQRGVRKVIHATLEDAQLHRGSLPAAGAFDVIEHIEDDGAFLRALHGQLAPGGRFYCTVPAMPALWSADDVHAGHFRRYTPASLTATFDAAGFAVEFVSPFFLWLTAPVLCFRALPSRLHRRDRSTAGKPENMRNDHRLPRWLAPAVERLDLWERERLNARRPLPFGTSLLCVARKRPAKA